MLDHLLPLIYREYECFDEANKENLGYIIRRRSRPVSLSPSTMRTPPRPPRRNNLSTNTASHTARRLEHGVVSSKRLKRRRESTDDGQEERGEAKKQEKESDVQQIKTESVKEAQEEPKVVSGTQQQVQEKVKTPVKTKKQVKKTKKQEKKSKKESKKQNKKTVTKKTKRIPLQDITHLYVNEHMQTSPRRERFPTGLTTSVAIRFF